MQNRPQQQRPAKAKLGQNFLIDPNAPGEIVRALGPIADVPVLEIGPGLGAITAVLARATSRLIAVEYDELLAEQLAERFAANERVEILPADILEVDLGAVAQKEGRTLRIAGNLPYYITSDILLHLFAHYAAWDRAVLMVQSEVAERITALPGGREYGVLSATTQLYCRAAALFTLPPAAFQPVPGVYSTVFRLDAAPRFGELAVEPAPFLGFVRRCFAQKRKTLVNNLRHAGYSPSAIAGALTACALPAAVRAEAVGLEEMACLFRALSVGQDSPSPQGQ